MNTLIVLTSTVNVTIGGGQVVPKDRLDTYLKSVRKWLTKSTFKICLVENSGCNFDELNEEKETYRDRFEVISYNENDLDEAKYLKGSKSKGAKELFAINYAFQKSRFINPDCFIIKVKARYFIPNLYDYLSTFDLNTYDCLTQNNRTRCDLVGCPYRNFNVIFNTNQVGPSGRYDYYVERVYEMRTSQFSNILVCKQFFLGEKIYSGTTRFGYWQI